MVLHINTIYPLECRLHTNKAQYACIPCVFVKLRSLSIEYDSHKKNSRTQLRSQRAKCHIQWCVFTWPFCHTIHNVFIRCSLTKPSINCYCNHLLNIFRSFNFVWVYPFGDSLARFAIHGITIHTAQQRYSLMCSPSHTFNVVVIYHTLHLFRFIILIPSFRSLFIFEISPKSTADKCTSASASFVKSKVFFAYRKKFFGFVNFERKKHFKSFLLSFLRK